MIVAATGHQKFAHDEFYVEKTVEAIFINKKPEAVIVGMADGFDLLVGKVGIHLNVPVWAYVPWPIHVATVSDKETYALVLKNAAKVRYISDDDPVDFKGRREKFFARNYAMVDDATHLLAYYNGGRSGTMNCWNYAEGKIKRKNIYDEIVPF